MVQCHKVPESSQQMTTSSLPASPVIFDVSSGSYSHDLHLHLTSLSRDSKIFYERTDENDSSSGVKEYQGEILVEGQGKKVTIKAYAVYENTKNTRKSNVVENTYHINYDKVPTPVLSFEGEETEPNDGMFYLKEVQLKLKSSTEDAQIQYKLSEDAETWEQYDPNTTLLIVGPSNPDLKIFFQATKEKMLPSDVVSKHFLYKEVL